MSKNSVRIWIVLSLFLAIGVAPFLARGDQETLRQLEANRQTMTRMSESQRDQLDRNFAAYQEMSAEEIAEVEEFHQSIELDRKQNAGQLAKVLDQYDEWLTTIEPFQRDQLKQVTDSQERVRLMTEIVREQRARNATSTFRRRFEHTPLADVPVLNEQDLNYFMEQVEELEKVRIGLDQRSELNRKSGIARFLTLLEMLKENSRNRPGNRSEPPRFIVKDLLITLKNIESAVERLIQDEAVKKYILKESEIPAVLRIQAVIIKSLFMEIEEQQIHPNLSSQQQLEQLFSSLPEEEQDQLLQLEAIDFYKELLTRSEPLDTRDDLVTQRDVFEVFDINNWSRGKRPPRPPGSPDGRPEGPPGERDRNGFRGEIRPGDRPPFGRDERPMKERIENRRPGSPD